MSFGTFNSSSLSSIQTPIEVVVLPISAHNFHQNSSANFFYHFSLIYRVKIGHSLSQSLSEVAVRITNVNDLNNVSMPNFECFYFESLKLFLLNFSQFHDLIENKFSSVINQETILDVLEVSGINLAWIESEKVNEIKTYLTSYFDAQSTTLGNTTPDETTVTSPESSSTNPSPTSTESTLGASLTDVSLMLLTLTVLISRFV